MSEEIRSEFGQTPRHVVGDAVGMESSHRAKAALFREMHRSGTLVLPNAWDAGSATVIARAGARAIATTSAGVAWSMGRPDGERLTRDEVIGQVRRIVAAVEVPVTADVERGYDDVAATVAAVIDAGAVGVNIEDSKAGGGPLFDITEQARRLRAGREAAVRAGLPDLVINARTDGYLFRIGAPDERLPDVLARAAAYAEAGADSLFVPGLLDLEVLATLVRESPLPVSVLAGPGAPSVAEFAAVGVRRVSVGQAVSQAAYSLAGRAATELITHGTYTELDGAVDVESMFT